MRIYCFESGMPSENSSSKQRVSVGCLHYSCRFEIYFHLNLESKLYHQAIIYLATPHGGEKRV